MNPLAMLAGMLSGTGFKIVTFIMLVVVIVLVYLQYVHSIAELKVNKQQQKINDKILAGTL